MHRPLFTFAPRPRTVLLLMAALSVSGSNAFPADRVRRESDLPAVDSPPEFLKELEALLDLGLKPDRKQTAEAERHFRELQRIRPDDPRAAYAYSLVLSRLFQPVDARKFLEAAADNPWSYAPAQQTLIRDLIKARKFVDAGERLTDLARALAADDLRASETAEWIGRIVACVLGPVGSKEAREQFGYLHLHLRMGLPAVLQAAYDRGFSRLEQEVDDLHASIDLVQMQAETISEAAKAAVDSDLVKRRSDLRAKQEQARSAGKEWDNWLADETKRVDEILIEMEKRFHDLENSATVQQSSVTSLRLMIDRIERGLDGSTGLPSGSILITPTRRTDVEAQLLVEEAKLNLVYAAQQELSNRAAAQLDERKNIVTQYQQATGNIVGEIETLKKWEQRAKRVAEREKKEADKKPASVVSLEARVRSLSTYDPFDFKIERERLLAEFGVVAARE